MQYYIIFYANPHPATYHKFAICLLNTGYQIGHLLCKFRDKIFLFFPCNCNNCNLEHCRLQSVKSEYLVRVDTNLNRISLLFNLQKENADKEKEKEKQERIEASLREREREVRASQAELAKAREKEKEQHLRDKAEQHFNALLADMVRKNVIFLVIKVSMG